MIYNRYHTRDVRELSGLGKAMPKMAFFMVLFIMASVGLPGTNGFIGEFLILIGAFKWDWRMASFAATGVILSAVYMLWMFQRVFFTVPSDWMRRFWPALRDLNRNEWIALAPLIVLVVALGVYPAPVLEMIEAPVDRIIEAVTEVLR